MSFALNKIVKFKILNLITVFRGNEGDSFFLLKVKRNNSKLDVVESLSFSSIEELKANLDTKIPVIILVDGKGILNKKIDLKNDADKQWLKNLDYESVHFTSYDTPDFHFLSFCRRAVLEELIGILQQHEIQVIDFYIGGLTAVLVNETLDRSRLLSNETDLEFSDAVLTGIVKSDGEKKTENYPIGSAVVSNFHLPLYGAAINFYVRQDTIAKSTTALINPEELIYKKAFERTGVVILISFFCLLFFSYCLIQYLNGQNSELNLENSYSNKSYTVIKDLELQKQEKLKILAETGFSSGRFISFYCYELTKSVPGNINLSFLEMFPLQKEIKKTEKVSFDYRIIAVKGNTVSENSLNDWIHSLKNGNWVHKLEIVSIKRDKLGVSYFELKITVKNV